MGLPEVIINIKSKAVSAVERSENGIVLLMVQDSTSSVSNDVITYTDITDVDEDLWSEENHGYIRQSFLGTPYRVIVCNVGEEGTASTGLQKVKSKKWNYLAVPFADGEATSDIASFIQSQRENEKKTFKAVLSNSDADHEGIINFTTGGITVGEQEYTAAEYTPRIAGILAGLPFTRSATYFVLPEVDSIEEHDDPDADIDNGELILIDDGEKIKIGRGVNSLTTFTPEKSEQFSKIKIIDGMDLVKDDIRSTFSDNYIGLVINDYDNKLLFLGAVTAYFQQLVIDNVLDASGENRAEIDFQAQRLYLQSTGVNVEDMSVQEILEYNTDANVFAMASVRFVDTMEDLYFDISA